jgi:hypothetical protein
MGKYIISLAVVTGCMLLFVHQQIAIIQCSYKINKNEDVLAELRETNKNLKFQLASYTSPTSLDEKLANADIDLVFPEHITVVQIPTVTREAMQLADSGHVQEANEFNLLKILGFEQEAQAEMPN